MFTTSLLLLELDPEGGKLQTHVGITLNPWTCRQIYYQSQLMETATMLWPLRARAKVIKAGGIPRAFAQMPDKLF